MPHCGFNIRMQRFFNSWKQNEFSEKTCFDTNAGPGVMKQYFKNQDRNDLNSVTHIQKLSQTTSPRHHFHQIPHI